MDDRYRWFFTFDIAVFNSLTIEEDHPDFWFVARQPGSILLSASLINANLYSDFSDSIDQDKTVLHSIQLPRCKLQRVFRRCEQDLIRHTQKRIPAFEYKEELSGLTKYCFAFNDRVILTPDSRFYREVDDD